MNITYYILFVTTILLFLPAVFSQESKDAGAVYLSQCSDSDGDNPSTFGELEWGYTGANTNYKSSGSGSGKYTDVCSEVHYTNILLYAGEEIPWGESVLVEGVCPDTRITAPEPGDLQMQTRKFYKCKCESLGEGRREGTFAGGVCIGSYEEIPREAVMAAEEKWQQSGKKELHPILVRFLRFFGLWG